MASERPDAAKGGESEKPQAAAAPVPETGGGGGIKAWLPLVLNIVLMPVLAYLTTTMLLIPRLNATHSPAPAAEKGKGEAQGAAGEGGANSAKGKFTVPLSGKILVNIAGTMGTRYLLANVTLVSAVPTIHELIDKNDAELRDVAAGVLATKTISDLEKPGARNLVRSELISVFNSVLGEGTVSELFLTEFAIQ
jgi:flagellar FliL protein